MYQGASARWYFCCVGPPNPHVFQRPSSESRNGILIPSISSYKAVMSRHETR
jgi:hypothetical protein